MVILRLGNSQEEKKEGTGFADYEITTTLGIGSFAKVKLAKHFHSHELFALEIIDKNKIVQLDIAHQIKREIATLKLRKHPTSSDYTRYVLSYHLLPNDRLLAPM
ncbi:hypothetical protein QN277_024783 [Acacia crassicarpa]|uniref:Protein kinase domain-containing protein n=1 Tax=Acacia crassicarpa TaxID=499986 RepID=A0AAE1JGS5_9FABA|nr:hypothetical protein QN277_024783 [Acacia crassicarpa]